MTRTRRAASAQTGNRYSLATNVKRWAEIMLNEKMDDGQTTFRLAVRRRPASAQPRRSTHYERFVSRLLPMPRDARAAG
jgi:hypothetical protein